MTRWLVAAGLVAALGTRTSAADAQEARACEQRASWAAATLDDDARHARLWYGAWMVAGAALIASQTAVAAVTTGNLQREAIVGASASILIPAVLLLHRPAVLSDAPALEVRLAQTTVSGRLGDPCVAWMRASELFARDVEDEALARSWVSHAGVVGINVALGLILGLGFGDWLGFAQQAIGGTVVGELQIWTSPAGAVGAQGAVLRF